MLKELWMEQKYSKRLFCITKHADLYSQILITNGFMIASSFRAASVIRNEFGKIFEELMLQKMNNSYPKNRRA